MSENHPILEVKNLTKYFQTAKGMLHAVDGVSFSIARGKTLGLVGESGCGKSTTGRSILRLVEPTSGEVYFDEKDILKLSRGGMRRQRKEMQIIFQDPYSALNPFWNVEEIMDEPMKQIGMPEAERRERMEYLLNKVGMKTEDLLKFPYEFSGGQRQRIGIARALTVNPEFIMCDEPIAALDVSIQAQVVNMLEDLQNEFGLTYLFAAHDLSMVRYISTRIGVMYLGNLVEVTGSGELYENPLHPYTQALLSAIPIADPKKAAKRERIKLEGELPSPMDVPKGCHFAPRCPYAKDRCKEECPRLGEIEKGHYVACHFAEKLG